MPSKPSGSPWASLPNSQAVGLAMDDLRELAVQGAEVLVAGQDVHAMHGAARDFERCDLAQEIGTLSMRLLEWLRVEMLIDDSGESEN